LSAQHGHSLEARHLGLIVNTRDPLSVQVGEYYAARRRILFQNVIRIEFPPGRAALSEREFGEIRKWIDEQTMPHVQAYAVTWTAPYRVECMSLTSALAFGFDPAFCAEGCRPTQPSRYFDSRVRLPHAQLKIRPAMLVAAQTLEQARALVDRGVESDGTLPRGTAYLLSSSDSARNVRAALYPEIQRSFGTRVRVRVLEQDALKGAGDVLFYFIGKARVEGLDTLRFVPGAVADHLTSAGGHLGANEQGQMSALRWLEAGATGSYGTVVEPCAFPQKFPNPGVLIAHYLRGDTLIEAYWKSVAMPGQGIFIGEPLAAPFRRPAAH
jgi:uncharacterized protein (TIGR03790 family)